MGCIIIGYCIGTGTACTTTPREPKSGICPARLGVPTMIDSDSSGSSPASDGLEWVHLAGLGVPFNSPTGSGFLLEAVLVVGGETDRRAFGSASELG